MGKIKRILSVVPYIHAIYLIFLLLLKKPLNILPPIPMFMFSIASSENAAGQVCGSVILSVLIFSVPSVRFSKTAIYPAVTYAVVFFVDAIALIFSIIFKIQSIEVDVANVTKIITIIIELAIALTQVIVSIRDRSDQSGDGSVNQGTVL